MGVKATLLRAYATIEKLESDLQKAMRQIRKDAKARMENTPSAGIINIASRLSHECMNDTLGYWTNYRSFGEERRIVLWANGAVTTFNETSTKNPLAMFRTRQKAIAVLRKAGWNIPYSVNEKGSPVYRKFIVATI